VDKSSLTPIVHQTVVAKGAVDTNCYVVACPETRQAAVIDPGAFNPGEVNSILSQLGNNGLTAVYVINTHGHIDHIAGNKAIREATGAAILIHRDDAGRLGDGQLNGSFLFGMDLQSPPADRLLEDGEDIELGGLRLKVLHTPGHTPGGICLLVDGVLFSGDTLFAGSVGRTDLPGGSERAILESIRGKLMALPDATMVRPGHGPRTTIGREKTDNPFLS
jgi:glyoxylase-like metal-dependent hydrolase (beta-lactamase superfamily II)